jgi:hypothetical protein
MERSMLREVQRNQESRLNFLPFDPPCHVVALSGGKDSTALALALREKEPRDYQYVITPTGNELPAMQLHWAKLERLLEKKLIRPQSPHTLTSLIEFHNALPNQRMRWCTRQLKIEPVLRWCRLHSPVIMYVGLRADEERIGIYGDSVVCDFPFHRWGWGIEQVLSYLSAHHIVIPERTDCALCYDQQLIEWWRLWKYNRPMWNEGKDHEARTGRTFRSPTRDTWPASLAGLEREFEAGKIPSDRKSRGGTTCRVCSL